MEIKDRHVFIDDKFNKNNEVSISVCGYRLNSTSAFISREEVIELRGRLNALLEGAQE